MNESKPLISDEIWWSNTDFPVDHTNLIRISSTEEQNQMNTERHKRNCFLYAMKSQNRAPKWLCW